MDSEKKWGMGVLGLTAAILLLLAGFTAVVDPVFHYHKPLDGLSYYIFDQRYQNDGIVKHFDYDAVITGTSMTENFRSSELDRLYGVNSVKVPFYGTSMREVADNLRTAFDANDHIEMVVLGLDGTNLMDDKDLVRSDTPLPTYLYDSNPFNDVSYLLNKQILLNYTMRMLQQTYYGEETTSFDDYSFWWGRYQYGAEAVLKKLTRSEPPQEPAAMDARTEKTIRDNIRNNVADIARENPETTFYCYFSPYCVAYWDMQYCSGRLQKQIEAYRIATEELLECDNIRLYSFFTKTEWTEDLSRYKDLYHHSDEINSEILAQLPEDTYLLTKDNFEDHWQQVQQRYQDFAYEDFYREFGWPFDQP